MRKLLYSAIIFFSAFYLFGQDAPANPNVDINGKSVSWNDLDFSIAKISLAGPSSVLIRNIKYESDNYSFIVKANEDGIWKISETFKESTSEALPVSGIFDTASISFTKENTIDINGILVNGNIVRSSLKVSNDGSLTLLNTLEPGSIVGSGLERAKDVKKAYDSVSGNETLDAESLKKIGNLEENVKKLETERDISKADLAIAQTKITELEKQNSTLQTEADSLKQQVTNLQAQNKDLNAKGDSSGYLAEITNLKAKAATLETQVETLKKEVAAAKSTDLKALEEKIAQLTKENVRLTSERNQIEEQIRSEFLNSGYIAGIRPLLTKQVLSGFKGGKASLGTWKAVGNSLKQIDVKQYFSRFVLPLSQGDEPMLYSFTLKSTGNGLVGAGLHLFASDSAHKDYGNGESLLVWFTRDPEHYKNSNTYLQLYKSNNDYTMNRALEASIQEPINKDFKVEILYQPKEEYITISVNGIEKIRYKTWFKIGQGLELAFRTLDTAEFTDFTVLTTK